MLAALRDEQQMARREIRYPDIGGSIDEHDIAAITKHLSDVVNGRDSFFPQPEERIFQEQLAKHERVSCAVAVSSCGTALDLCLAVLGIGPGDEVITSPLTFVATASSVILRGAKVVLADVDALTLNLSAREVRKLISPKTKCIIPVHFAGLPCDVLEYDNIRREYGIAVVYDSAHALGVCVENRGLATFGTASCCSFQFNKLMTCLGEGGAVLTEDAALAEKMRQYRTFGFRYPSMDTYEGGTVVTAGTNYQMCKAQYVAGIAQLAKLDAVLASRRRVMGLLNSELCNVRGVVTPPGHGCNHGSLHYIVRLKRDDVGMGGPEFRGRLLETYGVHTRHHYPALWTWEGLAAHGVNSTNCPIAAQICDDLITLPVSAVMTDDDARYVASSIRRLLGQ